MEDDDDYEYLDDLPEEYQCSICLSLLKDPHLTTCCGHHFCKECIIRVAQANQPCPMCKTEGFIAVIDKNVSRRIRALAVKCKYHSRGCEWTGELGNAEHHYAEQCQYSEVECPNGCGQGIPRSQIDHHVKESCPNRMVQCQYCNETVVYSALNSHYAACVKAPAFRRARPPLYPRSSSTTQQHPSLRSGQIVKCTFSSFGCSTRMDQTDLAKHLEECHPLHLSLVSDVCSDIMVKMANMDTKVQTLSSLLEERTKEVAKLQKSAQHELESKLQKQESRSKELVERLEHQVMQLSLRNSSYSQTIASLQQRISKLETQVPVPPYYFTVSNFVLHKQGGTQWTCPSFYSEVGGYKMAIEVSANGEGVGRGTHVSVYIRIMHGEFDDILRWPLRASVTIQLISQSGAGADYEMTTPRYEWPRVNNGVIGVGWGWDKFIPHYELEYNHIRRSEYLKNDRLNFRVISVDIN